MNKKTLKGAQNICHLRNIKTTIKSSIHTGISEIKITDNSRQQRGCVATESRTFWEECKRLKPFWGTFEQFL